MRLRFHAQTAAATLTKPQYQVNLVRTAFQALAAVLGGCQSLHTNGMDEAFTIPTEEAMRLALRTQQVMADETNLVAVADPLGGSYYVEHLTTRMERDIFAILDQVDEMGGTIKAIESGWFQRQIADSAYAEALARESGAHTVIGVNKYVEADEAAPAIEPHAYDPDTERRQIAALARTRAERDNAKLDQLMQKLREVAADESANIMPITIALVEARASMGEIVACLKALWGGYREVAVF